MAGAPSIPCGSAMLRPEHLIAAAEPKHAPAAPHMRGDVDVPALLAQCGEIGDGRLRPRQDDQVADGEGAAALDHDEVDIGLGRQRIEIVEIGDMRQERDGNPDLAAAPRVAGTNKIVGVFGGQGPRAVEERHEP